MKVVITDYGYESISQEEEIIRDFGADLVTGQCKTEDEVIAYASDSDAVICQFAPITSKVIDNLERCRVIVRYAVGVDNIDVKAAEEKGIYVCNVPDYGAEEVSNHALTLILMSARKIVPMANAVKS